MAAQIAIIDSPDTLRLSEEAQAALRLHPGSRISVTIEEGKVTLEPAGTNQLDANPSTAPLGDIDEERVRKAKAHVERISAELKNLFAGEPSLEDEFFRTRDIDKW
jgi:hypothetical protein